MPHSNYGDPSKERMGNGRPMSDLMRKGPHGLRGVVVASATPGGLPVNYNPHDKAGVEIHVEPDGSNATLTLDKMTHTNVTAALQAAQREVPGGDIHSIRERAAVAFEELARMPKSGVQRVPVRAKQARSLAEDLGNEDASAEEAEIQATIATLQEEAAALRSAAPVAVPIDKIERGYSPMAAFGLKKASASPPREPVVARGTPSGPPQKLVYFEKEGIGTVPAFFHEVLVNVARPEPDSPEETGFIVLVYDVRFEQSAARWFPPSNDPYQRPWAVQISDDNRLYLVHTTGFQYIYDSREFCILQVERAVRAPEVVE